MNILILCDLQPVGGTITYLTNFVSELSLLNHSVTIVSFAEEKYDFFPHNHKITQKQFLIKRRFYKISLFSRFIKLFSYLRKQKPTQYDLVISDYYLPAIAYFLCRLILQKWKKIKMFYQFHGSITLEQHSQNVYGKKKLKQLYYAVNYVLEKFCISQADKIICFSSYSRSVLEQTIHYHKKTVLIHPGREKLFDDIRSKYTKQQAREELGLPLTKKMIFLASRIEPRKGIIECLNLLLEERDKLPNTFIVMATNLTGLTDAVTTISRLPVFYLHLPPRDTLALLYRAADLTLMPSKKLETFGLTTLESFCLGTPVAAYDIGANKELIPTEFLASISQPSSLIDVVMKTLNKNNESRERLALSCIEKSTQYSWTTYANSVLSLLKP
ncbi:MAG: putative glycosyl transferase, group 1 [uncultured bacterium]|nr:MAG: putative glycosyl transferase, group 1 [uncultured bacterium]OGH13077.1 MAG: hypothetical protein A2687_00245 [Candidatus Levybacteria bacterium RIFCSPHIGHO2_01_FULL_38_26]